MGECTVPQTVQSAAVSIKQPFTGNNVLRAQRNFVLAIVERLISADRTVYGTHTLYLLGAGGGAPGAHVHTSSIIFLSVICTTNPPPCFCM